MGKPRGSTRRPQVHDRNKGKYHVGYSNVLFSSPWRHGSAAALPLFLLPPAFHWQNWRFGYTQSILGTCILLLIHVSTPLGLPLQQPIPSSLAPSTFYLGGQKNIPSNRNHVMAQNPCSKELQAKELTHSVLPRQLTFIPTFTATTWFISASLSKPVPSLNPSKSP